MILSRFLPLLSAAGVSAFTTTPLTTLVPPLDNRPSLSTSRQPDQASSSMLLLMKVLKDGDDADDKLGRDIISTTTTNGFVDHPLSADADLPTNHRTAAGGGVALVTVLSGLIPTVANAAGPDWGLFEGKTGSLLHPVMMGGLFLYTLYTAFLGFQWRRQRTMGTEITALQKQLPSGYNTVSSIQAALSGKGDAADAGEAYSTEQWKSYLAIAEQVEELQKERKDLAAAGPRDRHFSQGALLAFLGTAFAIEVRTVVVAALCEGKNERLAW